MASRCAFRSSHLSAYRGIPGRPCSRSWCPPPAPVLVQLYSIKPSFPSFVLFNQLHSLLRLRRRRVPTAVAPTPPARRKMTRIATCCLRGRADRGRTCSWFQVHFACARPSLCSFSLVVLPFILLSLTLVWSFHCGFHHHDSFVPIHVFCSIHVHMLNQLEPTSRMKSARKENCEIYISLRNDTLLPRAPYGSARRRRTSNRHSRDAVV